MKEPLPRRLDPRVEAVADNIRVDAATAETLRAFAAAGVDSLLLKGASIARWLYSEADARVYNDCDLLVQPGRFEAAERVLSGLGFEKQFDEDGLPEWWREHGSVWYRAQDGVTVDLHRELPNLGVERQKAWDILRADAETIQVGGQTASVLGLPARALHVALHAMHHGVELPRPMADLERALEQIPESVWREAALVAEQLGATDTFATSLQMTAVGRQLATRLALSPPQSVEAALLASTPPPVALGIERLVRTRGIRQRAAVLARKLVPPPGFMRRWHPLASRGRLGLLLAYLYRPAWILRRVPAGLRAWRRASQSTPR